MALLANHHEGKAVGACEVGSGKIPEARSDQHEVAAVGFSATDTL